ncbi:MAG: hypothetical protein M3N51_12050 [Actinomycetota bacterium]|nr:hypothetical protein [Actinomycetota bacterium]
MPGGILAGADGVVGGPTSGTVVLGPLSAEVVGGVVDGGPAGELVTVVIVVGSASSSEAVAVVVSGPEEALGSVVDGEEVGAVVRSERTSASVGTSAWELGQVVDQSPAARRTTTKVASPVNKSACLVSWRAS